jgi:hypothetical protein
LVTARSALAVNVVDAVELLLPLFGSLGEADVTLAVFDNVPDGVDAVGCATSVKEAEAPDASVEIVHVTVPVAPTAGVAQMNAGPVFCVFDTNVVVAGSVSFNATVCALLGPLLVTTIV